MKLAKWQKALLADGELYRVGGSVRDRLMGVGGRRVDVDYLVRGLSPERLEAILAAHGRLNHVGKSFGVYKFRPDGGEGEFDIAFPRRERSTGRGHREFDVTSDPHLSVEADLARRDFTINAIAERVPTGDIIDPFDGRADIESRTLRMIFPRAFEEDPLRILRGARFTCRFDLTVEGDTLEAMRQSAGQLDSLSAERVQEEFTKLLTQCARPSGAFVMLRDLGALAILLPELERAFGVEQNEHHPDDVFWHSLKTCDAAPADDLVVRWAALLHDLGKVDAKKTVKDADGAERVVFYGHEKIGAKMAGLILNRLRYGNNVVTRCRHLVAHHMLHYEPEWSRAAVRRFIRNIGEENLDAMYALKKADVASRGLNERIALIDELARRAREEIAANHALKIGDLAVSGEDVMRELGLKAGPGVGDILNELFEQVLESPELNRRETLLKLLRKKREG